MQWRDTNGKTLTTLCSATLRRHFITIKRSIITGQQKPEKRPPSYSMKNWVTRELISFDLCYIQYWILCLNNKWMIFQFLQFKKLFREIEACVSLRLQWPYAAGSNIQKIGGVILHNHILIWDRKLDPCPMLENYGLFPIYEAWSLSCAQNQVQFQAKKLSLAPSVMFIEIHHPNEPHCHPKLKN